MNTTPSDPQSQRPPFRLQLITDRKAVAANELIATVRAAVRSGVDALQLREKDLDSRTLLSLAIELRQVTREQGAKLLINDRIDVALAAAADGVHLPASSFLPADARTLLGQRAVIGVSTHSLAEALVAQASGADYILFGPVFDTPSKRAFGLPQGVMALRAVAAAVRIPVIAVGGIDATNIPEILQHGARGVAVISAILKAADVAAISAAMRAALPY